MFIGDMARLAIIESYRTPPGMLKDGDTVIDKTRLCEIMGLSQVKGYDFMRRYKDKFSDGVKGSVFFSGYRHRLTNDIVRKFHAENWIYELGYLLQVVNATYKTSQGYVCAYTAPTIHSLFECASTRSKDITQNLQGLVDPPLFTFDGILLFVNEIYLKNT